MRIEITFKNAFILGAGFVIGASIAKGIVTGIINNIFKDKEEEENGL